MSDRDIATVVGGTGFESTSSDGTGGGERQISTDEIFGILRNSRRRAVLDLLRSGDGTSTLPELAERIAADENDLDIEELSSQQRKRVYICLYQNHLPKMASTGLIEYDRDRKTVELRNYSCVAPYLSSDDHDIHWHRYVAFFATLVAVVSFFGIVLTSSVCAIVLASISVPLLLGTAVIELRYQRNSN